MKYIVEVGYKGFVFDDKTEALTFAETAFNHARSPETVTVKFNREEAEDE